MRNSETRSQYKFGESKLASAISSVLTKAGIPPERKGYAYLAWAIRLVCEDIELTGAVSKGLYPAVAEKFGTSPGAVERAMRTAIACSFEKRAKEEPVRERGEDRKTNSAFIFEATEQVKMLLDKTDHIAGVIDHENG